MNTGTVKWFNDNKGYGMIKSDAAERDIFVHFTSIQGDGFKTLVEGQQVTFDLVQGPKGPEARYVGKVK